MAIPFQNKYNRHSGSNGEAKLAIQREMVDVLTNFAVMVDECTDVNGTETASICITFLEQTFWCILVNLVLVQIVCELHHSMVH